MLMFWVKAIDCLSAVICKQCTRKFDLNSVKSFARIENALNSRITAHNKYINANVRSQVPRPSR